MAINWLCTGRDEHVYEYKTAEGVALGTLVCLNFKAEIEVSANTNDLYNAKPVLTEAGVEALVGLIPYAQGFTVLYDTRLTNVSATGVITTNDNVFDMSTFVNTGVGDYIGGIS